MHAAVIPVISYETGVDVHDFGLILPSCKMQDIEDAIRRVSALPSTRLEQMARAGREYAQQNHTREKFAQEYRKVIEHILATAPALSNQPPESTNEPLPTK
jgi:glycosyltransferase involved in cell wall biosynthesis